LVSTRKFWALTEQAALKVSRDRRQEMHTAFKLQSVFLERSSQRFKYLFSIGGFNPANQRSLSSVDARINAEWSESEETDLKSKSRSYKDVEREIDNLKGKLNSFELDDVFQALQQDRTYRAARVALADRVQELEARLSA
jgi:hypothetical protein